MASTVPANQVVLLASLAAAESAHAAPLRAGVGQADITPRTLVLQRGDRKVALVALDLFMVPGGLLKHVGDALASRASPSRTFWCYRPPSARGGVVRFRVGGRTIAVRSRGTVFEVSRTPGQRVSVPAGAARDRHGNRNGAAIALP